MTNSPISARVFGLALSLVALSGARLSAQSSRAWSLSSQTEMDSSWLSTPQQFGLEGADDAKNDLRQLSDAQLMAAYQNPDSALRANDVQGVQAHKRRPSRPFPEEMLRGAVLIFPEDRRYEIFLAVRAEIGRRGTAMRPFLIEFLRGESRSDRFVPASFAAGVGTLYVSDALKLLAPLRAGKGGFDAALACIEMLETVPRIEIRWQALKALEQLTLCSYFRCQANEENDLEVVPRKNAAPFEALTRENAPRVAAWYRLWLRGEGANSDKWLTLAQNRARDLLASDDLDEIYCAARFLSPHPKPLWLWDIRFARTTRDPAPDRTTARLAQILAAAQPTKETSTGEQVRNYAFNGQILLGGIRAWARLLANYGSHARPFASVLIDFQQRAGLDGPNFFAELSHIEGKEVVGYFVSQLPELEKRKRQLFLPIATNESSLTEMARSRGEREQWVGLAGQAARSTIDRWAGRAFDSDAHRLAWWQTAQNQTPEQWLRASLNDTASQADAGDAEARSILHQILPEILVGYDEFPIGRTRNFLDTSVAPAPEPFRVRWLAQHRRQLRYDPASHSFRLTPTGS